MRRERTGDCTNFAKVSIFCETGGEKGHRVNGRGDRFYPLNESYLAIEDEFQAEDLEQVFEAVSDRATQNHSEFVAEVFAALLLNGGALRQNAEVRRLFEKYGGVDIWL